VRLKARLAALLLCLAPTLLPGQATAQDYPSRQVRVLEPLAAASAVDVVTRLLADRIGHDLGQTFFVDNEPGASGLLGMRAGAKAAPDGYTILAVNDPIVTVLPNMRGDAGYDPRTDFVPVSLLARLRWVLVANPSLPANNVQEFIAYAKAHPGAVDFGSGGQGSPQHLAMELFMRAAGIKLTHVPYRGVIQAFTDLVSGHIPVMFIALPAPMAFVPTHQVKILGFAELKRLPALPDMPTIAEQGMPGFQFSSWAAWMAPAGTPRPIVDKLNAAIRSAVADPAINKQLADWGDEVVASTPEELGAIIAKDYVEKAELLKAANIHAD
jgi:tripartite-type tricarboxylate transporter receptor subunit TctC